MLLSLKSTTIEDLLKAAIAGWWLWMCRSTYLRQVKRREHNRHIYFGAPPCRTSIWRFSELCRENLRLHTLQLSLSSRCRYLSGSRWGCSREIWLIRLASRVNCAPQLSHVRSNLRSCSCRLWMTSVIALPSILPHWSHRCSTASKWTVAMWSCNCGSEANVREQYSHTNDFSAWSHTNNNAVQWKLT